MGSLWLQVFLQSLLDCHRVPPPWPPTPYPSLSLPPEVSSGSGHNQHFCLMNLPASPMIKFSVLCKACKAFPNLNPARGRSSENCG